MHPVIGVLLQVVLALWIVAGFADWWSHRRTQIERTSGIAESLCHWLLLIQMGTAIVLCIAFRPNLLLLTLLLFLWVSHQTTTFLELRWVAPVREITPAEQMTHSFLEILPVAGILLLSIPVVEQTLLGYPVEWTMEHRAIADIHWQTGIWPLLIAACLVFNGLAYMEETWRCLRWRQRRRHKPSN
ncbi:MULTISPECIES: hypothetical protein [unclassified Acidovorax]|uniref:hypothetical protein n=1 Tax=unclassified Acidovorax TaxID=2684926 RepID=UPI002882EE89|nr:MULTISPECIES: hypothetical protein [unclassified Acidovorax]